MKKFLLLCFFVSAHANEKVAIPDGKIISPYAACNDVVIVDKAKYEKNKSEWNKFEEKCKTKVQVATDIGITSINPLKEGVTFLDLSTKVAKKVVENLEKSKIYADCSASCFSGKSVCPPTKESDPTVQCSERKKEVLAFMKLYSNKIKMELALSDQAPGISRSVNISTALKSEKKLFINTDLRNFEIAMPNPVGEMQLTEREMSEALRRHDQDRRKLEEEYKEKGYKNYNEWMAHKLVNNFEEHQARYRSLIYEEAPIFSVIGKPVKFGNHDEPIWEDSEMAAAFVKLSKNAEATKSRVLWSIDNSTIEFSRTNGEAVGRWLISLTPGVKDQKDLLYYMGMKNQVEEVLKNDPSMCASATMMYARLTSKQIQNSGLVLGTSLTTGLLGRGLSMGATNLFRIGRALTGAEAAGLTGLALGGTTLADSFQQYALTTNEAATRSGASIAEGASLRSGEDALSKRDGLKFSLIFAPLDVVGGWTLGKVLYSSLGKQMAKDVPGVANIAKKSNLSEADRDQLVEKWLFEKIKSSFKNGILSEKDKIALESEGAGKVLEELTQKIQATNPDFFQNPKNMDFFFKAAATTIRKEKGDPGDLGQKAQDLLVHFNTEAMNGTWNPEAQTGLYKVFSNAIEELRLSASEDPATYAKFSSDIEAQKKVMLLALKRSGVKESERSKLLQCALP